MRIFIIILSFLLFPMQSFAEIIIPPEVFMLERMQKVKDSDNFLGLQIIQEQIIFNNSNIKKASIIKNANGKFGGLLLEMKPKAAQEMEKITSSNVGKKVNFVLNDKIISTSVIQSVLANKFIVTSINKEQAEIFVKSLNMNKH